MEPLVTVIALAYNHENYIRDALEGFVMQRTSFPVQYVIHDDASTDATADMIRAYEAKYPELIRPIYEETNQYSQGKPIALPLIQKAVSRYVAFCECDDCWTDPEKLQKQVDYMENHPECTLTLHNGLRLDDETGRSKALNPFEREGLLSVPDILLEPGGLPPTASMVCRTEVLQRMPREVFHGSGADRTRRMFLATQGTVYYFADCMSVYRYNTPFSYGKRTAADAAYGRRMAEEMIAFYKRFNRYTGERYQREVQLMISREKYYYFVKLGKYREAWRTEYYRERTPLKAKLFDQVKVRIPERLRLFLIKLNERRKKL